MKKQLQPDDIVNGVKNPCCICGKSTKNIYEISCQELGFIHGRYCNCMLIIGSNCLKKLRNKTPKAQK
jgi:hypothetical protein